MGMKVTDYYLGLDMGTSSVGWAVTDIHYKLLRAKGKDLWGVRLFDEAETAVKRRGHRISRRRRQREVARIGMLKELFADEINKIDVGFFQRMDDSKYHFEDKTFATPYSIFADIRYTDKEYYAEYPTIFHLRKELIESKEPHDVRLVYLALLNMFKHRGHFLNVNLDMNSSESGISDIYGMLRQVVNEKINLILPLKSDDDCKRIEEILSKRDISRSRMAEEVLELLQIMKRDKQAYEVFKGVCGLTVKIFNLFGEEIVDEQHKQTSFSFRDAKYDEDIEEIQDIIGEEYFEVIEVMKQLHDAGQLANIMKGEKFLSYARVNDYIKHKEDLALLKRVVKEYTPDEYDAMFREMSGGSYGAYVNSTNSKKKERRNTKERAQLDLYKTIKALLKKMPPENEDVLYITKEIDNETFLPKQLTFANGVIPNQVHLFEMQVILNNASTYLPFLNEKDESGLSVSEKILELFKFQIPYYVGPLSEKHKNKGGNAWVVRRESGKVFPWNFEQKIDTKSSAEEFISKMVRRCTYLSGEMALPKTSLLYEKFMVLNELNNLRIRGEKPSVELKQKIYKDLFGTGRKVKRARLFNYLVSEGVLNHEEVDSISGIDGDFKTSLSTIGKFRGVLGNKVEEDSIKVMIENIVFWGTVYGNDKKFFKERIEENYCEILTKDEIKRIAGFKFKDWGRLSKEFLELTGCSKETGEVLPLICMLWERNDNLMELLGAGYTYAEELSKKCCTLEKVLSEIEYEDLDDLYLSVPVKRMVWQTLLVVKEVEKVLGSQPKRIFVEMTRSDGEKGVQKKSRKKKLLELYKSCKEDKDLFDKLNNLEEAELRSKKLYLYYTQRGRCMYTGEPIDLYDLMHGNRYDIDHIYPRHFVKDDSIENNLVLVCKKENAHKSDTYPVEDSIYDKCHGFWKTLLSKDMKDGLITREKYNRLINRNELSEEQLSGFINRQLVETGQGTKAITQIFNQVFDCAEVVFVKAGNVSDFRHSRDLLKCRSVNDFHHAQDAYLNIVVGNTYLVKFTKNPMRFVKEYRDNPKKHEYHMSKIFDYTVQRNGEIAWICDKENKEKGTIVTVKEVMKKNTPLVTRMNFEAHGGIANQTLYGAKKVKDAGYIPLKTSDVRMKDIKKYGGFSSVSTAYFFLVEHTVKGKRIRTLEAMPIYLKGKVGTNKESMEEFCKKELGLIEPDVCMKRIKIQSLIKYNGIFLYLAGKTGNQLSVRNAVSLHLDYQWVKYIKKMEKGLEVGKFEELITSQDNLKLYDILSEKHINGIYSKRPNPVGEYLKNRERFVELELKEQCFIIQQILVLSQLITPVADLRLLGGKEKSGKTLISKTISNASEVKLINQSPTGLFENEIDLLSI